MKVKFSYGDKYNKKENVYNVIIDMILEDIEREKRVENEKEDNRATAC